LKQRKKAILTVPRTYQHVIVILGSLVLFSTALLGLPKVPASQISFDVASVKRNNSHGQPDLHYEAGSFSATNVPIMAIISFAYDAGAPTGLRPPSGLTVSPTGTPKWVMTDNYDVEARAPENTSTDQMRAMMRSLLSERCKMTAHIATNKVSAEALVALKSGHLGPKLHPFDASKEAPCLDAKPMADQPATLANLPNGLPQVCGHPFGTAGPTRVHSAGRKVTMHQLAELLSQKSYREGGPIIVDQTGLTGGYDFTLDYFPVRLQTQSQPDDAELPTLAAALQEQLGLKLTPTTTMAQTVIIDHIEPPSPN